MKRTINGSAVKWTCAGEPDRHECHISETLRRSNSRTTLIERMLCILVLCISGAAAASGQQIDALSQQKAIILGTAFDVNGGIISGASVLLEGTDPKDQHVIAANSVGFFEFKELSSDTPYHLTISAPGFANWTSSTITLKPGQCLILTDIKLRVAEEMTTVDVRYSAVEVATEQVQVEEQQRVFGIIPNFYVVYDQNPEPLTAKLKFKLAYKVSTNPVTFLAVASYAGMQQAGNTPDYRQGAKGYGQRLGAGAADGFANIMIGGAILPSLLHQDPRYFYQGTGSNRSRFLHAISNPFVCRGDNGHLQPNYSSIGGDLASSALANAYYPSSNRGARLVFGNLLISTGERVLSSVAQEFVLGKFTTRGKSKF